SARHLTLSTVTLHPVTLWQPKILFLLKNMTGAEGDRTLDLRIANATLSQLSYRPTDDHPTKSRLSRPTNRWPIIETRDFAGLRPRRAILASRNSTSNRQPPRRLECMALERSRPITGRRSARL